MIRLLIRDAEGGEASFPVTRELVIGRSRECDIRIEDASVSRKHARVFLDYGDAVIEDMDTPNGTLVNKQKVVGRLRLKTGDSIQVGSEKIRVVETSPLDDYVASTPEPARKTAWDETLPFDKQGLTERPAGFPSRESEPPARKSSFMMWAIVGGAILVLVAIAVSVLTQ
jgi:predicted component of type VI protein secretion system